MAKVSVRFVFANSNATVDAKVAKDATGMDLKLLLFLQWPKAVTKLEDPERLRIICLGRVVGDDEPLLSGSSVKLLSSDSPLPINVSIRPSSGEVAARTASSASASTAAAAAAPDTISSKGKKAKAQKARDAPDRDTLGDTPALKEVCQCIVS
jgi:hypothetical protein